MPLQIFGFGETFVAHSRSETYTPGHTANAVSFMARRRAETHAAFFLPFLRSGDRVLDCGCGPGRITRDFARIVGPTGAVTGIDRTIDQAADGADTTDASTAPVRFEAADVYALPFADASFDAVFSHALFEHLREPPRAAREILRVLKAGGVVGLRSPDWGGFLLDPFDDAIERAIRRYEALVTANGGDIFAGRRLSGILRNAGAEDIKVSATYEIYPDAAVIAEYLALQLDVADGDAAAALRRWGANPHALFAQAWGEVIGRRPA